MCRTDTSACCISLGGGGGPAFCDTETESLHYPLRVCVLEDFQSKAWPAQQRTSRTLWRTRSFTLARAGPRYLRGSNSLAFSAKALRTAAVMASRRSVSMLTL